MKKALVLFLFSCTLVPPLEAQQVARLELGSSPSPLVTLAPFGQFQFPLFQKVFREENAGIAPASFVVTNASDRPIIGIAVRWIVVDKERLQAESSSRTHSYLSSPSGPLAAPGARMLVAPDTFVPESILQSGGGVIGSFPAKETNAQFAAAFKIRVEIDCIIFGDGEVVGPNNLGLVAAIVNRKMAAESVVKQVDAARKQGKNPLNILLQLSQPQTPSDAVGERTAHFATQLLRSQHFEAELGYFRKIPYPPRFFRKDGGAI